MRGTSRALRWLLRLYPRAFRERYGEEIEAFHVQERVGGAGSLGYWARLLLDHVRAAAAVRRAEGDGTMRLLLEDLRVGARTVRRTPSFTAFAALTLALGVGATTAVFSVVDRVLLRPLPYPGAERMVRLGTDLRHNPGSPGPLSPAITVALRAAPGPAEAVEGATTAHVVLSIDGDPERLETTQVTPGFFELFGAQAAVGRLLTASDDDAAAPRTAVLGYAFWQERYGGDPAAVGRSLLLNGLEHVIVGALAADFVPPPNLADADDVWVPMRLSDGEPSTGMFSVAGVARLRPGSSLDDFVAHGSRLARELYPASDGPAFVLGVVAIDYRRTVVGDVGSTLWRVLAAVALLLVISCVNVASLQMTRGAQRARELALRAALGAGRIRLLRQLVSESVVLALLGGAVGSGLAFGAVRLFRRFAPADLPRLAELGVDGRALLFSLVLSVVTALAFGLIPALGSTRRSGVARIGASYRAGSSPREGRVRGTLVAVETALAVLLAVGSTLLARDLVRMATEDPGFRPSGVVSMQLDLAPRYDEAEWAATWERLLDAARAVPGVEAAALATQVPYSGDRMARFFRPEGTGPEALEGSFVVTVVVAGDYLRVLGTPLVEGRWFGTADGGRNPVAVVNRAFARRYWPGEAAVGRTVQPGGAGDEDEPRYEVVGVVADMITHPGRDAGPRVYLPLRSQPWRTMELAARTDGDAAGLAPALRDVVRQMDPELPVSSVRTVESLAGRALATPRFYTTLFASFALVALGLAVVGVYGTTAYAARSRTREIGIRMALGARRAEVVGAVVTRTAAMLGAGVALGLVAAALPATRGMAGVLQRVEPGDAASYVAAGLLVWTAGVAAALVPAARAGAVDPATTLREE